MARSIIVIGAGIGGLATAALLGKLGWNVTVLEKNEQAGGRASQLKAKGFTFDMGPSWYLMPDVFERFFQHFNLSTKKVLNLIKLNPQYRVFFSDGTKVDITGDIPKDKKTFEALEPGSSSAFDTYLAESKVKYDLSMKHFLYKNVDSVKDFFSLGLFKHGRSLHVFESMDSYVKSFFKTEKMQQIIQYTLVFLGGAPKNTPALYSLMSHIDFNLGVWYPKGGMYSVVTVLVKLGKKYGVTYIYNSPVTAIITEENGGKHRVTAVKCGRKTFKADVVISNADYAFTEDLLKDQTLRNYSPQYWQKRTLGPSSFILYLGVKGKLSKLAHHNLLFGKNWQEHFQDIFDRPTWPRQPSIYINKQSGADSSCAPKGHEAVFILVPVAAHLEESKQHREEYAEFTIKYIEEQLKISLTDKIIYKKIFSITDFKSRYNAFGGSALGLAHTLWQTSLWRPSNYSKKISNLFFVGASTVPGIGVPICLISAELVSDKIQRLVRIGKL
ncbi:MAG: phytoene desaturase family protein [bacterium]|nr:phytoene desaturase family protein [bacterium]